MKRKVKSLIKTRLLSVKCSGLKKGTNIRYESICLGWYSPGVGVGLGSSPGVGVGVDAPCVVAPGVGVGAGVSPSPLAQSAGTLFPIKGIGGLLQIMVMIVLS